VGFMESIAIGKQLASKHKYELDSSIELIGLGMANFCGSIFNSYPVTGSFSRSAVNNESGAQSGISGIVTATLVMLVLLFLTPVFERMVSLECTQNDFHESLHLSPLEQCLSPAFTSHWQSWPPLSSLESLDFSTTRKQCISGGFINLIFACGWLPASEQCSWELKLGWRLL